MPDRTCVRLPLQTGGGALAALLWTALAAGASFGAASLGLVVLTTMRGEPGSAGGSWLLLVIPAVVALAFGSVAFVLHRAYRRQRATDVEVGAHELRFVDGPLGGTAIPWDEVESCTITKDPSRYVQTTTRSGTTTEYLEQLRLARRGEEPRLLAESLDPEEKASLAELRLAILGACEARGGHVEGSGAAEEATSVVRCDACGAPVAAVEAAETPCASCGATVRFDPGTAEKIRSASELGRATVRLEEVVRTLLDQPSATSANRPLDLFGALVVGLPAAAFALFALPGGGAGRGFALLAVGVPLAAVVAFLARRAVADRQALRALTAGMGARNPARAGEPPRCRQCGGTLLVRERHVVAICLFCRAENVLGLDLRPAAASARSRGYELGKVLAKRNASRVRTAVGLAASVAATALALYAVIAR